MIFLKTSPRHMGGATRRSRRISKMFSWLSIKFKITNIFEEEEGGLV